MASALPIIRMTIDGSQLLRISKRYNVHISVQPDPLSIRIEGYANSIATIEALFDEQRKVGIHRSFNVLETHSSRSP